MVARKRYSFWLDADLDAGLKKLKSDLGVNESETIRRAVRAWLERHGAIVKADRPRAATRKRS